MLDNPEELLEELKRKVEELERELENLEAESAGGGEISEDQTYSQITHGEAQFILHWILPDEMESGGSDEDPCDIDTVTKAQEIFKSIVEARQTDDQKREILHGDVMVLLCNTAKEEDEETGEATYPDSCYYVGMCVQTGGAQEENPADPEIKIAETFSSGGESIKEVIVWNTCGPEACPEDPEAIQVQEFRMKPDDEQSSPGSEEELHQGVTARPPPDDYSPLATIDKLKTLALKRPEEDDSSGEDEDPKAYALFDEPDQYNSGVRFKFSNRFDYENVKYDYVGTADRVSIQNKEIDGKLEQYSARDVELVTVSISSDSCGSLKVEDALDENDEPIKEDRRVLMSDDVQSSMEIKLQDLNVIEASEQPVSIANVLEQNILQDLDEPAIDFSANDGRPNDNFFVPQIIHHSEDSSDLNINNDEALFSGIPKRQSVEIISEINIKVTDTLDSDGCKVFTLTPQTKKKKMTFHGGLLTHFQDLTGSVPFEDETNLSENELTVCEGDGGGNIQILKVCNESGQLEELRIKVYPVSDDE
jgi:hypothetical protein